MYGYVRHFHDDKIELLYYIVPTWGTGQVDMKYVCWDVLCCVVHYYLGDIPGQDTGVSIHIRM